ncbi:hypothetical protein LVB77_01995 [Lysobacter sp. 5GHs7-4]|uniref:hypothetical protein n=1 Tax=Lysobacter sp. 5GHs7-4 TaxID=2904253 RepID=UPI001E4EA8E5|nr:hypothetical protein [Lysobacter sp. 5GHs7-4]UHQ23509.1 hypothetical protein LVB77_01995 [Lysobacter sp. 5GHs7-4]
MKTIPLFAGCALLAACATTPQDYPLDRLQHFVGTPYSALQLRMGRPHREKSLDDGTMAIWGANVTGPEAIMANDNCQFVFVISTDGLVRSVDMTGRASVCRHFIDIKDLDQP